MEHSGGADITSNYIGAYPLEKMLEYNHCLLHDKPASVNSKEALAEQLKSMSEEDKRELLMMLLQK